MPRRVTLTDRQREALLHLPVDQGELLRHYTLSDEDLGHIRQRRRAHNRFGFALQLCVLRYPGRRSEEHTSAPVTNAQLVCRLLLEKTNNKIKQIRREY